MKILIAEDDTTSRMLLKVLLKSWGSVDAVEDGAAAVEAFRAALQAGAGYELVFLDLFMPVMDGRTALGQVRALESAEASSSGKRATIILATAADEGESLMAEFEGRCDAILPKPMDRARIDEVLGRLGFSR